jgi:hypothetical protein
MLIKKTNKLMDEWEATDQPWKDAKHSSGITLLKNLEVDSFELDALRSESPLDSYIRKDNTK